MINKLPWLIITLVCLVSLAACKPQANSGAAAPDTMSVVVGDSTITIIKQDPVWITDYDLALQKAKAGHKYVLIDFTGSDWCIWCQKLHDEVLSQKEFLDFAAENFILVKLDFPKHITQSDELKQQNEALAQQYSIDGYPTIVILNSDGKEINRAGYQQGGAKPYVQYLRSLLK